MPKFYVTYGIGSNLSYKYSVVVAPDYSSARRLVDDITNGNFDFMYDENKFKGQIEKHYLSEVPLQPQEMYDVH